MRGPRTEPCGTPDVTGTSEELSPSSTTAWVLPTRKIHSIQSSTTPDPGLMRCKYIQSVFYRFNIADTNADNTIASNLKFEG